MKNRLKGSQGGKMSRLLRQRSSQHYFNGSHWIANPNEAKTFSDIIEAAEACSRHGLTDVEVALRVDTCEVFCTRLR